MPAVHVDDFGGTITITVKDRGAIKDLTSATLIELLVQDRNGAETTLTATKVGSGSTGQATATITSGLLALGGRYKCQAIVTTSTTSKFHSDWMEFIAKPNL